MQLTNICSTIRNKAVDFFNGTNCSGPEKEIVELFQFLLAETQQMFASSGPDFIRESQPSQLRRACLEWFQKVACGDYFRPCLAQLIAFLFKCFEVENEDNTISCAKQLIDISRSFRPSFTTEAKNFLRFVCGVYRDFERQLDRMFESSSRYDVKSLSDLDLASLSERTFISTRIFTQDRSSSDAGQRVYNLVPKSRLSLKVLQEIPVLVIMMQQTLKATMLPDLCEYIPIIIDFSNYQPSEEQKARPNFNHDVYTELMGAQVKTLSFLAYVVKMFQDILAQNASKIVTCMKQLAINCPSTITNMRKEYFVATRHVLNSVEIRTKFLPDIDIMLDENILIGPGYGTRHSLRPLAYSTLADLVYHLRGQLSLTKIARVVEVFGRNLHDDTLPFAIQSMSLRLLLNMADCISDRLMANERRHQQQTSAAKLDEVAGDTTDMAVDNDSSSRLSEGIVRRLLYQIAHLLVLKARTAVEYYLPTLESSCISEPSTTNDFALSFSGDASGDMGARQNSGSGNRPPTSMLVAAATSELSSPPTGSGTMKPAESAKQAMASISFLPKSQLSYQDLRALVKNLIHSTRTVVSRLIRCPHPPSANDDSASGDGQQQTRPSNQLTSVELELLSDYFQLGMRLINIVQIVPRDGRLYIKNLPSAKSLDERALIENFAHTFNQLSLSSFQELMSHNIKEFVSWCHRSSSYMNLAVHFLNSASKSPYFLHILLTYLFKHIDKLGEATEESTLYTRLFKMCLTSFNNSSPGTELVMKYHLRRLVQGSLECSFTARDSTAYLSLLRSLFRSLGFGSHERSFAELLPVLPELLCIISRWLRSPLRPTARDLLCELCIFAPVRFSVLQPFLSLVMEPLVYSLNCTAMHQALRVIEMCVDNLKPSFLFDQMSTLAPDILLSLFNALHSSNEASQKTAFKILGKLGPYNRMLMSDLQTFQLDPTEGDSGPWLRLYLREFPKHPIDLPIQGLVDAAIEVLQLSNPVVSDDDGDLERFHPFFNFWCMIDKLATSDQATKQRAWNFLQAVLVGTLNSSSQSTIYSTMQQPSFATKVNRFIVALNKRPVSFDLSGSHQDRMLFRTACCVDGNDCTRQVIVRALGGLMLDALHSKPVPIEHGNFTTFFVRHLTMLSVINDINALDVDKSQCSGSSSTVPHHVSVDSAPESPLPNWTNIDVDPDSSYLICLSSSLNPALLIDALVFALGHEQKTGLAESVNSLLEIVISTASTMLSVGGGEGGGANQALSHLSLFRHLSHVIVSALYHPAWYVKWGGCAALVSALRYLPPTWCQQHFLPLFRALFNCINELAYQIGHSTLSLTRQCINQLFDTAIISLLPSTTAADRSSSPDRNPSSPPPVTRRRRFVAASPTSSSPRRVRTRRNSAMQIDEDAEVDPAPPTQKKNESSDDNELVLLLCAMPENESTLLVRAISELIDALLSDSSLVRVDARHLLVRLTNCNRLPASCSPARLVTCILSMTNNESGDYLKRLLVPQPPARLVDLPLSSQLALLEANYFFGQCGQPRDCPDHRSSSGSLSTSSPPDNSPTTANCSPSTTNQQRFACGAFQYSIDLVADRNFVNDLRSIVAGQVDSNLVNNSVSCLAEQSCPTTELGDLDASAGESDRRLRLNTSFTTAQRLKTVDLRVAASRVLALTASYLPSGQKSTTLNTLFKALCSDHESVQSGAFLALREFVNQTSVDIEQRHINVKPILANLRPPSSTQATASAPSQIRLPVARQLAYCAQLFPSMFNDKICDAVQASLASILDGMRLKQNTIAFPSPTVVSLDLAVVLMEIFYHVPLATAKRIPALIDLVIRAEQSISVHLTNPLRQALTRFLSRYAAESCMHFLTGPDLPYNHHAHKLFLYMLACPHGQPIVDYLKVNNHILCDLIKPTEIVDHQSSTSTPNQITSNSSTYWLPRIDGPITSASPRNLAIQIVHAIHCCHPEWLDSNNKLPDTTTTPSDESRLTRSRIVPTASSSSTTSSMTNDWSSTMPDLLATGDSSRHPVLTALLAYWCSDMFCLHHSTLTTVKLGQVIDQSGDDPSSFNGERRRLDELVVADNEVSAAGSSTIDPSTFYVATNSVASSDDSSWNEPRLISDCLMSFLKPNMENIDLLFTLIISTYRLRPVLSLHPFQVRIEQLIADSSTSFHRRVFMHYVSVIRRRSQQQSSGNRKHSSSTSTGRRQQLTGLSGGEDVYRLLAYLVILSATKALTDEPNVNEFMGGPTSPIEPDEQNIAHLFVTVLLNDPFLNRMPGMRVMYYELGRLLLLHAPDHLQNRSLREQSYRIRRLMEFAYPCRTTSSNAVDLQEKYTGIQLLTFILAKFALSRVHTTQVFHQLAKGSQSEAKRFVSASLDILLPTWIQTPDGPDALAAATRRLILDDQAIQSCSHVLGIIVRHSDVYYLLRRQLLSPIVSVITRLSHQTQLQIEQRRLAVDAVEMLARWEQRSREPDSGDSLLVASTSQSKPTTSSSKSNLIDFPLEKGQREQLLNLMLRFACHLQAYESPTPQQSTSASGSSGSGTIGQPGSSGEPLLTRSLSQIEYVIQSDVWGGSACDLRLIFMDRCFNLVGGDSTDDGSSSSGHSQQRSASSGTAAASTTPQQLTTTHVGNVIMILEVLRVLFTKLESQTLLANVKHFNASLCILLTRHLANLRLIRPCSTVLRAMLERYPADPSHRQKITSQPELYELYSTALKAILDTFNKCSEPEIRLAHLVPQLHSAFTLFNATQVQPNPYAFVDRCIVQLVKLTHRLIQDSLGTTNSSTTPSGSSAELATLPQITELLITGLETIKSRFNVLNNEMRRTAFGPDLCLILERTRDQRLFTTVVKMLRDWINVPKSEEHFAPTPREKVAFFQSLWQAYPRWVDYKPTVGRDILNCIYEVYNSPTLYRNPDLYNKLEQAFYCSMLAPFPDIRERFVFLMLEASQIIQVPSTPESTTATLDSQSTATGQDSSGPPVSYTTTSLFQRFLFLFVSCQYDEARFDNNFWLPFLIEILLTDVNTSLSPCLSPPSTAHFADLDSSNSSSDPSGSSLSSSSMDPKSSFNRLVKLQQIEWQQHVVKLGMRDAYFGLLCLLHRHPALTSQLFTCLWPQIWNGLLLQQPIVPSNWLTDGHDNSVARSSTTTSSEAASLSPNDIMAYAYSPLLKFINSDQHLRSVVLRPNPLGSFLSALTSTCNSLLTYFPLHIVAYVAEATNQWHQIALYLESACERVLTSSPDQSPSPLSEYLHKVTVPVGDSPHTVGEHSTLKPHELPYSQSALALIALYGCDADHLTAAWWYRLKQLSGSSQAFKALELAQLGEVARGLELLLTDCLASPINSSSLLPTSASQLTSRASGASSTGGGFVANAWANQLGDCVNRSRWHDYCLGYLRRLGQWDACETMAHATCSSPTQSSTATSATAAGLHHLLSSASSSPNGGQSLPTANALMQATAPPNSSSAVASSNLSTTYHVVKVDQGWRKGQWHETLGALAKLQSDWPRPAHLRLSLIESMIDIAQRRRLESTTGSLTAGSSPQQQTSTSSVLHPSATANDDQLFPVLPDLIQSQPTSGQHHPLSVLGHVGEYDGIRSLPFLLAEWRRLPLVIGVQHAQLLQSMHRVAEMVEGNNLLGQLSGRGNDQTHTSSTNNQSNSSSVATLTIDDYRNVLFWWKNRPPCVGDDFDFCHDLYSWRQLILEHVIGTNIAAKPNSDRSIGVGRCQADLASHVLELARGASKLHLTNITQQQLEKHIRLSLPSNFGILKEEVQLRLAEVKRDDTYEALDLLDKVNLQLFDRRDRARFFCYKAQLYAHLNKGDDASKNFGYAAQIDDCDYHNWSAYGEFLYTVFTNSPASKRETSINTTGVFAMQALLEAVNCANGNEYTCRSDLAKILSLLSYDDDQQHPLAHAFDQRTKRLRPELFLPWLPTLSSSLMRPEGRFIARLMARAIGPAYPGALYQSLRGLLHQLTSEANWDAKVAELMTYGDHQSSLCSHVSCLLLEGQSSSAATTTTTLSSSNDDLVGGTFHRRRVKAKSTVAVKRLVVRDNARRQSATTTTIPLIATAASLRANKKHVMVVMRGADSEPTSSSMDDDSTTTTRQSKVKKVIVRSVVTPTNQEVGGRSQVNRRSPTDGSDDEEEDNSLLMMDQSQEEMEVDEEDIQDEDDTGDDDDPDTGESESVDEEADDCMDTLPCSHTRGGGGGGGGGVHLSTGCMSKSAVNCLNLVDQLIGQLRRNNSTRLHVIDLFTVEVGGRLQPTWSEQLIAQLSSILSYLTSLLWNAKGMPRMLGRSVSLKGLLLPQWVAAELTCIAQSCGGAYPIENPRQGHFDSLAWQREYQLPACSVKLASLDLSSSNAEVPITTNSPPASSSKIKSVSVVKSIDGIDDSLSIALGRTRSWSSSPTPRSTTVFHEVNRLLVERLKREARADPHFTFIRERLLAEMSNLGGQSVLTIIQRLTDEWIPLVEHRVAKLPSVNHLADFGAHRLLELASISTLAPGPTTFYPSVGPGTYWAPRCASPCLSLLELPGDSSILPIKHNAFQFTTTLSSFTSPSSKNVPPQAPSLSASTVNCPTIALCLTVADILPQVARLRSIPGSGCPGRRIGLRGSNGRLYYYDLATIGLPITLGSASIHADAVCGAKLATALSSSSASGGELDIGPLTSASSSPSYNPSAYSLQRQRLVGQLLQLVNDTLAGSREAVKRQLTLFVPRVMEVGPSGLALTESCRSALAGDAVTAVGSNWLSTGSNLLTSSGLTNLGGCPVSCTNTTVSGTQPTVADDTMHSSEARAHFKQQPLDELWDQSFEPKPLLTMGDRTGQSDEPAESIEIPPQCPPILPTPTLWSSLVPNSSSVGKGGNPAGHLSIAAHVNGHPTGLDSTCHPSRCTTLTQLLDKAASGWTNRRVDQANNSVMGSRQLVCTFYTKLADLDEKHGVIEGSGGEQFESQQSTEWTVEFFDQMAKLLPQSFPLDGPLFSNLVTSTESMLQATAASASTTANYRRGFLLRRWAATQFQDVASLWQFRRSLACQLGALALVAQVFNLGPIDNPNALSIDPRSGLVALRQPLFELPSIRSTLTDQHHVITSSLPPTLADKTHAVGLQLLTRFVNIMALRPLAPAPSTASSVLGGATVGRSTANNRPSTTTPLTNQPPPIPFRLTPHLAGFVCMPGCKASVGPLAGSLAVTGQALCQAQRVNRQPHPTSLASTKHANLLALYRTLTLADYTMWHRGRQASLHAYQLLMAPAEEGESVSCDHDAFETTTKAGRKTVDSTSSLSTSTKASAASATPREGPGGNSDDNDGQQADNDCTTTTTGDRCQGDATQGTGLLSDLSLVKLTKLTELTVDATTYKLRVIDEASDPTQLLWPLIDEAVDVRNLALVDPAKLPWL